MPKSSERTSTKSKTVNQGPVVEWGALAHELRRPVTVVRGLSDLLIRGSYGGLDAEQSKQVQLISDAAEQLNGLIDSLASQAWAPGDRRPIYFRNLIRQTVDGLRAEIVAKRLQVRESYGTTEPPMLGEPERMRAVILNLLANAIKYSPRGAAVEISLDVEGNDLIFEVRDHGPGITAADQRHIFERGFRSRSSRASDVPGLGLGLFIVWEVIEERGGKVEVESTPGQGALFRIRFKADPGVAIERRLRGSSSGPSRRPEGVGQKISQQRIKRS